MGQRFVLPAAGGGGGGARSGTGGHPRPAGLRHRRTPPTPFSPLYPPGVPVWGWLDGRDGGKASVLRTPGPSGVVVVGGGPVCSPRFAAARRAAVLKRGGAEPVLGAEPRLETSPRPPGWAGARDPSRLRVVVWGGVGWGLFSELPPRPLFPKSSQAGASRLPERDGKGAAFGFVEDFGFWGVTAVTEDGGARNNAVLELMFPFVLASCPRGGWGAPRASFIQTLCGSLGIARVRPWRTRGERGVAADYACDIPS